ncbi:MAG: nucleotide excision repair endonuclease, partial [Limisphaerales bacterium]
MNLLFSADESPEGGSSSIVGLQNRMLAGVRMGQQFLFEPERPLVTRLGQDFFRRIPEQPGVYKMRDGRGQIVYVGKADNLRQRLRSYRVANPERLGRRHLRLLQAVVGIDFDLCESETAALQHEAKLIRELRPKFNRAGVWQGRAKFLVWRFHAGAIEMTVQETPAHGWDRFGPLGAYARRFMTVLARLLWLTSPCEVEGQSAKRICDLPCGWLHGRFPEVVVVELGDVGEVRCVLEQALCGEAEALLGWLAAKLPAPESAFELGAITSD